MSAEPAQKIEYYVINGHDHARHFPGSHAAYRLLDILRSYMGADQDCFPSRETLAECMRITPGNVDTHLASLVKLGYIRAQNRFCAGGDKADWVLDEKDDTHRHRISSRYTLLIDPRPAKKGVTENRYTVSSKTVNKEESLKKTQTSKSKTPRSTTSPTPKSKQPKPTGPKISLPLPADWEPNHFSCSSAAKRGLGVEAHAYAFKAGALRNDEKRSSLEKWDATFSAYLRSCAAGRAETEFKFVDPDDIHEHAINTFKAANPVADPAPTSADTPPDEHTTPEPAAVDEPHPDYAKPRYSKRTSELLGKISTYLGDELDHTETVFAAQKIVDGVLWTEISTDIEAARERVTAPKLLASV